MTEGKFICAGKKRGTWQKPVAAPWFRREFALAEVPREAKLSICGLGLYRLYLNGKDITGKAFAPYMCNTDHLVYWDVYDVLPWLVTGENVVGVLLGNGWQNAQGGATWGMQEASFQSEPKLSFELRMRSGEREWKVVSDSSVLTHPSPVLFDDLWYGEYYDARRGQVGWCRPGLDTGDWKPAEYTEAPRGEARLCGAVPVREISSLRPVAIRECPGGYLYDFGENNAGVCALHIRNTMPGQEIVLIHGEYVHDGMLDNRKCSFLPDNLGQQDRYICRGGREERWQPVFTYHGFRYVYVQGVTREQADEELLTYRVIHADLGSCGGFSCSDPVLNQLQEMTRRSTLSNYCFFPTDCPQREKNGWTGDAALSAEQIMLNFEPDLSQREWLRNICRAQDSTGMLPGIVPTGGWGMGLGGPAWDSALVCLPFYLWKYRGDTAAFEECREAILRYLRYAGGCRDEKGLIEIGLGDWMPVGQADSRAFRAPVSVTDTAFVYDMCRKVLVMMEACGNTKEYPYVASLAADLYKSARKSLVDWDTCEVAGQCQTSQAVFLYFGLFREEEEDRAMEPLLKYIAEADGHMDVGILGGRVLFHVLSSHGYGDLAYKMVVREDFPSYGNWVARGATTLWEDFTEKEEEVNSRNHHMWGDISSWMIQRVAGLQLNPSGKNFGEVLIKPDFTAGLEEAEAWHVSPQGCITVHWHREGKDIDLEVSLPEGTDAVVSLGKQEELRVPAGGYETVREKEGVYYRIHITRVQVRKRHEGEND